MSRVNGGLSRLRASSLRLTTLPIILNLRAICKYIAPINLVEILYYTCNDLRE